MSTQPLQPSETLAPAIGVQKNVPKYAAVPSVLTALPNFVVWREEKRNGKPTKVPYDAKRPKQLAKTNDPSTWASFDVAVETAEDPLADLNGVGFMLQGTNLVGIDFDGVIQNGAVDAYVLDILKQLGNPYCEVTPSTTGLRVFMECPALPKGARKFSAKRAGVSKYGAEIYAGGEGGRYLTITGDHHSGKDVLQSSDLSLSYYLISQFASNKFKNLWVGDSSDYENDDSRADLALLSMLANHFEGDRKKVEEVFGKSPRGHREKWLNRADYRDWSLTKALSGSNAREEVRKNVLEFHSGSIAPSETREYVIEPAAGEMDGWFPLGAPSLLGGSSGANKSTIMMQMIEAQQRGADFLGHQTKKRPSLVINADRTEESYKATCQRMRIDPSFVSAAFMDVKMGFAAVQEIVDLIEATAPLPQVVFIEGADMLVEDGNKKSVVATFMCLLRQVAQHFRSAIICSTGSPKSKAGEGYTVQRDQISGSEAWARLAETVCTMKFPEGNDLKGERVFTVSLRNAPAESFALIMDHGRLRLQNEDDMRRVEGRDKEINWVREQELLAKSDPTKRWWTVLDLMLGADKTERSAYRWVKNAHAKNWIAEKPGRKGRGHAGLYRWNDSKTNPLGPGGFVGDDSTVDVGIED